MPITRSNFDEISQTDFEELVSNGVAEGHTVEYKQELYGNSDSDKREFLKDVTSFANTKGGHLIIGVTENAGLPTGFLPIHGDVESKVRRLESLMHDGCEPRLLGVSIRSIQVKTVEAEGHLILLRIPRSWQLPHRVSAQNHNKYYARNSTGVYEPGVEELRTMFVSGIELKQRMLDFRDARLKAIDFIGLPVPLASKGTRLIMHLLPHAAFVESRYLEVSLVPNYGSDLAPIGSPSSHSWRYNFDGMLRYRAGNPCHGYTQLFRTGAIEAHSASIETAHVSTRFIVPRIDAKIIEGLSRYLNLLKTLGVVCPFSVFLTLQSTKGRYLGPLDTFMDGDEPILEDELALPQCMIESFGTSQDYARALRPAFDALWNAGGRAFCPHYNQDGSWKQQ
jgi:hypothetical protein